MNHYEILGVKQTASQEEIKQAFRGRAKRHHPDRNPNDRHAHARFNLINEAYETLSDPGRRRTYDRSLGDAAAHPRETGTRPSRTRPYASPGTAKNFRGSPGSGIQRYDERRAQRPAPPQPVSQARRTVEAYEQRRKREEAEKARQARLAEQARQERLAERARQELLAEQAARQRMQESLKSEPEPEPETSEVSEAAACGCLLGVAVLIFVVIVAIAQCGSP